MTHSQTMSVGMVEITQADRDAVAALMEAPSASIADDARLAEQAFAHHRMEERAAIVAWLRSEGWDGRMEYVADCIEAGEHLK